MQTCSQDVGSASWGSTVLAEIRSHSQRKDGMFLIVRRTNTNRQKQQALPHLREGVCSSVSVTDQALMWPLRSSVCIDCALSVVCVCAHTCMNTHPPLLFTPSRGGSSATSPTC